FVSVGMLFNPHIVVQSPLALFATVMIIVLGKSVAAFLIVRLFGRDKKTALTISASLAQIGEFSFILATLGTGLALLPTEGRDLILAGAILSILVNPLLFRLIDRAGASVVGDADGHAIGASPKMPIGGHIVLVGHGRVGGRVASALIGAQERFAVIEAQQDLAGLPQTDDRTELVIGNAAKRETLERARIGEARLLFVAIPQSFEAGQIVQQARALNPSLRIVARAHTDDEVAYLCKRGSDATIMGEEEVARRMTEEALTGI
uniref:NAD-binding protein n=1 Tax=Sphingomonas sp. TaxID=28214 RepID=UPI003B3AFCF1